MQVIVEGIDLSEYVVLRPDDLGVRTLCEWVTSCPCKHGKLLPCEECPACDEKRVMTHAEAVEWWREQ